MLGPGEYRSASSIWEGVGSLELRHLADGTRKVKGGNVLFLHALAQCGSLQHAQRVQRQVFLIVMTSMIPCIVLSDHHFTNITTVTKQLSTE